jgi:hypothetical protein
MLLPPGTPIIICLLKVWEINLRRMQQTLRHAELLPGMLLGIGSEDRLPGSSISSDISAAERWALFLLSPKLGAFPSSVSLLFD